jgi:small-conductance mechanosensitive channel
LLPTTKLNDYFTADFGVIFGIVYTLIISWLLINAIKGAKYFVLAKYDIATKDNLKARKIHTQLTVLERLMITTVVIISTGIILMSIPQIHKIGVSLLASAGIAGIIIGFAAQKSIALILAGFQIAITQPIRLEDVVIVEGEWGWIEEITLTYVVVRIWDKRRLIVPITYFIEKPFENWTRTTSEILGTVFIHVDYGFPVDEMRKKLTEILEGTLLWDRKVNVLQVTAANDRTLELRALVSAADSPTAWDLRVLVREQLIKFVQDEYPQFLPKARIDLAESLNNTES